MWSSFFSVYYGLIALALTSSITADYYVDNANDTVSYTSDAVAQWRTFSISTQNLTFTTSVGDIVLDPSKCYDQNYAVAACNTNDNCQIQFPFTGSGIVLYVVQGGFQGVIASLSVDGENNITATLPPPGPPSHQTPNVSIFNIQHLPSTKHTATVNVLSWEGGTSSFYFDYAHINESYVKAPASTPTPSFPSYSVSMTLNTAVISTTSATLQSQVAQSMNTSSFSPSPTTSSAPSSFAQVGTTSPSPSTKFRVNIGGVVGGASGGLAALTALLVAVVFLRKRKARQTKLEDSRRPDPFPSTLALTNDQAVSFTARPQPNEKVQMRLVPHDRAAHQPPGESDGNSSALFSLPVVCDSGRVTDPEACVPTIDDAAIDWEPEDRSSSSSYHFVVGSAPASTADSAPPGYQTLLGNPP